MEGLDKQTQMVVALELVCGIFDNVYVIIKSYAAPFQIGFFIVHLIIITKIVFVLQVQNEVAYRS